MKIQVKWMRESFSGKAIRVRYKKRMVFIPKSVLIDWDDSQFYYYNEEFTLDVKAWFLKKLEG